MSSMTISLSPPLDDYVEEKVRSGDFRDRTEVVERALKQMREDDVRLERLREAINEGLDELDAGLGIEVTDVRAWLDGLGR